jgi:hypothetical protein
MRRVLAPATLFIAALSLACEQTKYKAGHGSRAEPAVRQPEHQPAEGTASPKSTGLVLQADQGERMVRRWACS